MQRRAPVRGALEHRQVTDGFGDLLDRLHRGGAGTDDADPLAGEIDAFLGPAMGMARQALEARNAGDVRHRRGRKNADGGDQKLRRIAAAPVQHDLPAARLFAVMRRRDSAVELDIATQVEFVGHVVEVPLGLGLKGSDRIFQAQYY